MEDPPVRSGAPAPRLGRTSGLPVPLRASHAVIAAIAVVAGPASTVAALMPVGVALGLSAGTLIAVFPAVTGYLFLPTYGTIIAAIAFDRTGTTRIGRYVLNHSFMVPGLVTTAASLGIGWLLVSVIF